MTVPTGFSRRVVFFAGIVGLAVSSVLVTDDVSAALITWDNPTDGEWDTGPWTPPGTPGADDDVLIPYSVAAYTVSHSAASSGQAKSLSNQASLVVSGGSLSVSESTTNDGPSGANIEVTGGEAFFGSVHNLDNMQLSGGNIYTADFENSGEVFIDGATVNTTGTVTNLDSGNITQQSGSWLISETLLNEEGQVQVNEGDITATNIENNDYFSFSGSGRLEANTTINRGIFYVLDASSLDTDILDNKENSYFLIQSTGPSTVDSLINRESASFHVLQGTNTVVGTATNEANGEFLVLSFLSSLAKLTVNDGFTNAGTLQVVGKDLSGELHVISGHLDNTGTIRVNSGLLIADELINSGDFLIADGDSVPGSFGRHQDSRVNLGILRNLDGALFKTGVGADGWVADVGITSGFDNLGRMVFNGGKVVTADGVFGNNINRIDNHGTMDFGGGMLRTDDLFVNHMGGSVAIGPNSDLKAFGFENWGNVMVGSATGHLEMYTGSEFINYGFLDIQGGSVSSEHISNMEDGRFFMSHGTVAASFEVRNMGEMQLSDGLVQTDSFLNTGTLTIGLASIQTMQNFVNDFDATVDISMGGSIESSLAIDNRGAVDVLDGNVVGMELNNWGQFSVGAAGEAVVTALKNRNEFTVSGGSAFSSFVTNEGVLWVDNDGRLETEFYRQVTGETRLTNGGIITAAQFDFDGGSLTGDARIIGNIDVDGARLEAGQSTGTLTIEGDLNFMNGVLEIEINSLLDHDFYAVMGEASFAGGALEFVFGSIIDMPFTLEFLRADSITLFDFDLLTFDFLGLSQTLDFNIIAERSSLYLIGSAASSPVDEPPGLVLFLFGLVLVGVVLRWRTPTKPGERIV